MGAEFFSKIGNIKPYLKIAFEGFAGSGKTHTAAITAIGLYQKIKSTKPIVFFDSEKAEAFIKPLFDEAGIEVLVRRSKSFADLKEGMKIMREQKISDIFLVDSITHFYNDFIESYKQRINRKTIQFQDWGILKPLWKEEFADRLVDDPYHFIMCGRAGYEYSYELNEDTGKKELIKDGIKMKVDGETAHEPDLLVLMERFQEMEKNSIKRVYRQATIIKDRSRLIDGKVFENPTYESFSPFINFLLTDKVENNQSAKLETQTIFVLDEDKRDYINEKKKALEEIEGLLISAYPGSAAKEKKNKVDAVNHAFKTFSWTTIEKMKIIEIREGIERIKEFIKNNPYDKEDKK